MKARNVIRDRGARRKSAAGHLEYDPQLAADAIASGTKPNRKMRRLAAKAKAAEEREAVKKIEFGSSDFPVSLRVERDNADGGDPLGLSAEALDAFCREMTNAFRKAALDAMEKGILPRAVELKGSFKISGVKR